MRENLQRSIVEIFSHEGAMSLIRSDPGNWTGGKVGAGRLLGTKYGIAANSYPNADIPNLTLADAALIYARDYWAPAGCDRLFPGVDLAAFDLAVNSGVGRVKQLLPRAAGSADHSETVKRLCALRLAFMRSLKTWTTFGRGWTNRVLRVEATGVAWALTAMKKSPAQVVDELRKDADKASGKATTATTGALATGTAAGGSAAGGATQVDIVSLGWNDWLVVGVLGVGALIILVVLIRGAFVNGARAKAYEAVAADMLSRPSPS